MDFVTQISLRLQIGPSKRAFEKYKKGLKYKPGAYLWNFS